MFLFVFVCVFFVIFIFCVYLLSGVFLFCCCNIIVLENQLKNIYKKEPHRERDKKKIKRCIFTPLARKKEIAVHSYINSQIDPVDLQLHCGGSVM